MDVRIQISEANHVIAARRAAATIAEQVGFSSVDCTVLGVVVSELARNILDHAVRGEVVLEDLPKGGGVRITARDEGAGLHQQPNVFKPGHGLWAVLQGVDDLVIGPRRDGRGTCIVAAKFARPQAEPRDHGQHQASRTGRTGMPRLLSISAA